ncbi:thrombospondin type 3 repeat-/CalX-beta domain-containing protein [Colwellia sp. MB02u-14]|nr:thrombospondin type 3 repeat-/CalX-beta domain-containing protein [Colwellia sp. MB02u-14]
MNGNGIIDGLDDVFPLDPTEYIDTDGDGIGNTADTDDDTHAVTGVGDGSPDGVDKFPLDPNEYLDTDGDGIGNNTDIDDDGDGVLDDYNANGIIDCEVIDNNSNGIFDCDDPNPLDMLATTDTDGDGIENRTDDDDDGDGSLDGIDKFPLDPNEYLDTDNDGVGDNADTDKDGDGIANGVDPDPTDPAARTDTDGDGLANETNDNDDDNDGVADNLDLFPLNAAESIDTDGDGIGNNSDPDDDNDGFADSADAFSLDVNEYLDTDSDGTGNNTDDDDDGDGIKDSIDAFPLNPLESVDTDGDLIGNNTDSDDDNDGFVDSLDAFPLDFNERLDTDSDGIGNNTDTDDDNDTYVDSNDLYPLDANEWKDSDGDGIGDNADADDDNDNILDVDDAFPFNPGEITDTDGDGIGDVLDTDDDGDGVLDNVDLFPLDPLESLDSDNDGIGNNSDSDDDNDGVRDVDDAFPLDPIESVDTDGDGIGNVNDIDDDNDGVLDYIDALPLDPTESLDFDVDGVGNNADPDDDNDGMSDVFELKYGFNPFNVADALMDTDSDGTINVDEERNNTNPLIDDYAPVITVPEAVHLDANHTFTALTREQLVKLTEVYVEDGRDGANCCSLTPVGFEQGQKHITSGVYNITWRAVDDAGNVSTIRQILNVYPLVNFSATQILGEGATARVDVILSGEAPYYPIELPFAISGNADSLDYKIADNKVVINEGTTGFIDVLINKDFQAENDEQLILSFGSEINAGVHKTHTIVITETNIVPVTELRMTQNNIAVSSISKDQGEVTIELKITDVNPDDLHIINWLLPEYINAEISANQLKVYLQPDSFVLPDEIQRLIVVEVSVTDNGNGELSQTHRLNIPVNNILARLDGSDTDSDGIADNIEGYADEDNDGVPAFLDNNNIAYLQPLHVNAGETKLMETEPGLRLRLGKYALQQFSDGVQMSQQEMDATGLVPTDDYDHRSDYFDFEIHNVTPFGASAYVVIPLNDGIPNNSLYRKFNRLNGWQNFVENSNNSLASSAADNDVCPPPQSNLYQAGLSAGHQCVRLWIEDGGANDADGLVNGIIDDPGGIALVPNAEVAKETDPEQSSSGSMYWLLLFIVVSLRLKKFRQSSL